MKNTTSTFEDLVAWQKCREFRKKVSKFSKELPKEETFRLADQMIRASRSVTANIAEGYGRFHYKENMQYCRQARGSLYEMLDHFVVAMDEKYIKQDRYDDMRNDIFEAIKVLNGYIKFLKAKKDKAE